MFRSTMAIFTEVVAKGKSSDGYLYWRCAYITLKYKFFLLFMYAYELIIMLIPTKCTILLCIILQLMYYNSSMFRSSSGHLQGVHKIICVKHRFCLNKLGKY